ncbi:MAG: DUF3429 domain-containing protein [Rubrimonas sp.]
MRHVPLPARVLGLAGLAPFVALAVASIVAAPDVRQQAQGLLAGYGATILAFMGGCRWGLASAGLGSGPSWGLLTASVIPALWAWGALALGHPLDLAMIAVGLAFLYVADVALTMRNGAPDWWPALRRPLTWIACASLAVGMIR